MDGLLPQGEGEMSHREFCNWSHYLEEDLSVALWVKCRGKWQAGIKCSRADWPLSTLKAKPTHDKKKYFVIFFPTTRNYSWADSLLVCSITEFPEPTAHKTHSAGLEMVKDLTFARRFNIQKLAVGMLSICDRLHSEALVETARNVTVWKEFAAKASLCEDYKDLGRMILKLRSMILDCYINVDWLHDSFDTWVQNCQDVQSAESFEILKEELVESIMWNEINLLWDAPVQQDMGPEWKTWKQDAMKLFSILNPISSGGDTEQNCNDNLSPTNLQTSRKRAKLEIRRADFHTSSTDPKVSQSHQSLAIGIDTGFFDGGDSKEAKRFREESDRWDQMIVEGESKDSIRTKEIKVTPATKQLDKESRNNRQCIAFVESKGRQCVRWANEGDVYCCVHLAARFVSHMAKSEGLTPVDQPICGGTTTQGTRCKHRSLVGSAFCKKHRPFNETKTSICKDLVVFKESESLVQSVAPVSVLAENSRNLDHCIGSYANENDPCVESPKRHLLYCEKHLPSWLKRARNGKSRIISKEVFMDLLKECSSHEEKLHLHQACELFYRLFKSVLSLRNPVPKEIQFQWAISEASRNFKVGEFLMKLVLTEKDRLARFWGFNENNSETLISSTVVEEEPVIMSIENEKDDERGPDIEEEIKCKICSEEFIDGKVLGSHFMESHKKEVQWMFRGYVCAICLDSFTNKKILETHVQERHHVQFVEHCLLFQCIPCSSHFGNLDELWSHVLSSHLSELRLSKVVEKSNQSAGETSPRKPDIDLPSQAGLRKFVCRFCGLKFDLLPDLGRHHQAAHMGPNPLSSRATKRGIRHYAYKLKSGRLSRPRFKKGIGGATYRIRSRVSSSSIKKRIQVSNAVINGGLKVQSHAAGSTSLGRLVESQCSSVAKMLFSEIQKTKARPNNHDIFSIAQSTCCKGRLQGLLEDKYGILPERLYLKAAKLCSEHNIQVEWHREGYNCPKGCKTITSSQVSAPLMPPSNDTVCSKDVHSPDSVSDEWELDECHYVLDSQKIRRKLGCRDISFGKESVPVAFVVDDNESIKIPMPWESFNYVTKPLLDDSLALDTESVQLGCCCEELTCSPLNCDHVYLFDNDYEDAKDIDRQPMLGRFPYDEKGRIILEEGYPVYECNPMCRCSKSCQNRVLQNGLRVKLEIFKTEKKGWGVRAVDIIPRGTFVCEFIGEVVNEQEAKERHSRYEDGCSFFYYFNWHLNDMSRLIEGQASYVIDATKYGNVSRFINHSCLPNLVNYQVLVECMDFQLAHIGLYANCDIAAGEELTYDYRYELVPGEGQPCYCGAASKCRGRLC